MRKQHFVFFPSVALWTSIILSYAADARAQDAGVPEVSGEQRQDSGSEEMPASFRQAQHGDASASEDQRQRQRDDSQSAVPVAAPAPVLHENETRAPETQPVTAASAAEHPSPPIEAGTTHDTPLVSEIVVSATKTTAPASYAPVTSYTVDRPNIESQPDYNRANYGQLVQDVPGVFVGQATYKTAPWINLRGTGDFSARTLYLVDGLPVGSSVMLTNAISVNDIERIDIVMGPSSALYGANASGGVVNIITRQGAGDPGFKVSYGFGSNNTHRPYASATGAIKKEGNLFHYAFSYSGDYSDGYKNAPFENAVELYNAGKTSYLKTATVDPADNKTTYLAGKLGWKGARGASLTLAYNYSRSFAGGGQPNLVYVDNGYQGVGSLRFQLPIGEFLKVTVLAGYQSWDRPDKVNKGLSLTQADGPVVDPTLAYTDGSKVRRTPIELQGDVFVGKTNIITAGGFFCSEKIQASRYDEQKASLVSESTYNMNQLAVYLQDQAFFFDGRLSALAGLRYDYWKHFDLYDTSADPTRPSGVHSSTATYRGGLKYRILDQLAVRTSAGTAYYPGLATWYFQNVSTGNTWREANPNLKPEKTWMVDFGVDGKLDTTGTSINVTAYYGKITDMFSGRYDPHPTLPNASIIRYSNIGESEIYGLETRLVQRIVDDLSLAANLTLNHSEIVEDPVNQGHQISHAPSYMANVAIRYLKPTLLNGTLVLRAIGKMHYDNENIDVPFFAMKASQTVDAKVWRAWQLGDRLVAETSVTVENLFDRHYAPEFYYASPGRTIMAVLGLKY